MQVKCAWEPGVHDGWGPGAKPRGILVFQCSGSPTRTVSGPLWLFCQFLLLIKGGKDDDIPGKVGHFWCFVKVGTTVPVPILSNSS